MVRNSFRSTFVPTSHDVMMLARSRSVEKVMGRDAEGGRDMGNKIAVSSSSLQPGEQQFAGRGICGSCAVRIDIFGAIHQSLLPTLFPSLI